MDMDEDYIKNIEGAERRFFTSTVELREDGAAKYFDGAGVTFGSVADLGWFTEEILPGAFDDVMQDDVRGLVNHDPNLILGRNKSGTMQLVIDGKEARYKILYNPNDPDHVRYMEKVKRGDISQSSFAFSVKDDKWETRDGKDHRIVTKIKRWYDVSMVTYPAYHNTSVAARSVGKIKEDHKKDLAEMDQSIMRRELKIKNKK